MPELAELLPKKPPETLAFVVKALIVHGVYCTNLSRLAEEPGKEEDLCSNDPIASFGDFWKKWRIGRSSDNRTLRNWAARLTSKSDVMRA